MCLKTAGPCNAAEALSAVRAGLDWLASADAAGLSGDQRADCLRALAAAEAVQLAATSKIVSAFDAAEDYAADGQGGPRAWLAWQARMTRPAAGAAVAWARRLAARRRVAQALAAGQLSVSYARRLCDWIDELPDDAREAAEDILVQAAADSADLSELATLFEEIRLRTARPDTDDDDDRRFGLRSVLLDTYYRGNGYLRGDLTRPAAAALQAVLDALGTKVGPEDTRTREQRAHDALEEACRRLIASGCLPERAGQPVQIVLHMTLAQLLGHAEFNHALASWIGANAVPAPPGADCDAAIVPIVTGAVDLDVLTDLVDRYPGAASPDMSTGADPADDTGASPADASGDETLGRARRAAAGLTISDALQLLSGPGGLASRLRGQLTGLPGTISLPLDVGAAADIPVQIRRAVTRRDHHCRFPGCYQPAIVCHVHHLRTRAEGGDTSVTNCCLLCSFHHLVVVHRWGWTLILNPDGTTTAVSPDRTRTLHSHAPPTAAA
jgi:hypothetical protein